MVRSLAASGASALAGVTGFSAGTGSGFCAVTGAGVCTDAGDDGVIEAGVGSLAQAANRLLAARSKAAYASVHASFQAEDHRSDRTVICMLSTVMPDQVGERVFPAALVAGRILDRSAAVLTQHGWGHFAPSPW